MRYFVIYGWAKTYVFAARLLRIGVLLPLIGLWLLSVSAAQADVARHLVFKHVLPDKVESVGHINDIVQDAQGFMWFGGSNGLARYDGYSVAIYRNDVTNPNSLPSNYVNDLLVTSSGELWIGSRAGLHLYDVKLDRFINFAYQGGVQENTVVNDVNFIWQDQQQRMWLATHGGLFEFSREPDRFRQIQLETYPARGGNNTLWVIAEDAGGYLWLGHQTGGVTRFHPDKNTFNYYRHDPKDRYSISSDDVRYIYVDSRNRVWLGTYGSGLNRFDRDRERFERYAHETSEKGGIIWDVLEDKKTGEIWVGDGQSVSLLNEETAQFTSFRYLEGQLETPGNHVVTSLFQDQAGDIWLGFFPSGVDMVDARSSVFHNFRYDPYDSNSITDGGVIASFEDSKGNLWIGTGFGLTYFDRQYGRFTRIKHVPGDISTPSGSTVLSVAEDYESTLWLGIWSGGLNRRDTVTGKYTYYLPELGNPRSLWGKEPWDVFEDSRRTLWIATEMGLNRYDRATDDFTRFLPPTEMMDGDTTLYSRVLYEDSHGNLWWGTVRGLFLINRDTGEFTHYHHVEGDRTSLGADFVTAIYEDRFGHLWLGTEGGGVSVMDYDTRTFTTYTVADGLADDTVSGIQGDRNGHIWLSTHKGLSRFDLASKTFRNFDKRHGLSGNLFNRNTPLLTRRGELLFGNSKGFSLFNPTLLADNSYLPPVVLTDFQIFNKSVTVKDKKSPLDSSINTVSHITLQHRQSVFSFSYAALNYRSSEDNQYAYRLVGFDQNWNEVGSRRLATYTNLDPGEYYFEVRGSNNDGLWNKQGQRVGITVLPPLWRTWWAYTLYCMALVLLLGWFFYTQKMKVVYEQQKVLQERAVVKKLREVDRLKDEFLANTSHELRTPLNGIIGLAQSLMDGISGTLNESARQDLRLIVTSGRRLAGLVDDILDFSKLKNKGLQLYKRELDLRVLVDVVMALTKPLLNKKPVILRNLVPQQLTVVADEDRLQQILHNLLGNAAKFTDTGEISVAAEWLDDTLQVVVRDTGIGIPSDQFSNVFESFQQVQGTAERAHGGTGLGLSVTKKLVELHGGSIKVDSELGSGSVFTVLLPRAAETTGTAPALVDASWMDAAAAAAQMHAGEDDAGAHARDYVVQNKINGKGAHILIVDDEPVNLKVLYNMLALHDFRVTQASQGVQALAEIEKGDVDLIILDVMMPRLSGYDICRQIRQHYSAQELPIILLTARTQTQDLLAGFDAGANDYLTKPVAKEELLARVTTHLQHLEIHRYLDKKVAERTHELHSETRRLQETQTHLQKAYKSLEEFSVTDPLTGLKNRRFLSQHIERDTQFVAEQYQVWLRHNDPLRSNPPHNQDLIFILLDVDFFKPVNDTHGHGAGDRLLEQLAALLQKTLRDSDYLVRWGGEEFLVVARATGWREAAELVERLRVAVEKQDFRINANLKLQKTCSIGFAAYPFYPQQPTALNWEQVVDRADQALYIAKNSGRNCWVGLRGATAEIGAGDTELPVRTLVGQDKWICVSSQGNDKLTWG